MITTFYVGDLVRSVSNHGKVRVVVRANWDKHESIAVAECDVYAGKAINISEIHQWSLPAYWELGMTDDDNLKRVIEQEVKKC